MVSVPFLKKKLISTVIIYELFLESIPNGSGSTIYDYDLHKILSILKRGGGCKKGTHLTNNKLDFDNVSYALYISSMVLMTGLI